MKTRTYHLKLTDEQQQFVLDSLAEHLPCNSDYDSIRDRAVREAYTQILVEGPTKNEREVA